jgi:hypothetical protein
MAFAPAINDLDAPQRRRQILEMNVTDVESAALGLPVDQRRALALRLWESVELEPGDESVIRLCEEREQAADAASDGWMDAAEFLAQLRKRPR